MTIGIVGAGTLGSNLARALVKAGVPVLISNSRGPESLKDLTDELGSLGTATTAQDALNADIVVIAVPWVDAPSVLRAAGPWNGRIVIDGTNPLERLDPDSPEARNPATPLAEHGIRVADLGGRHASAIIRDLVPGARVVKTFNHRYVHTFHEPDTAGGKRVMLYSGDDAAAKQEVRTLIEKMGFWPVDLGTLDVGGPLATVPTGALTGIDLIKA